MFRSLMPREGKFFDLFQESADLIVKGAHEFKAMLGDMKNLETRAKNIKDLEHRADTITHRTIEMLHTTFITPMDREDIYALIGRMDDILDFIEATSQRFFMYGITSSTPECEKLADICVQSAETIKRAIDRLHDLKNSEEIIKHCVEINRLENEADHVMRTAMAKLFREEPDTRQLIKLKEIYELLETVTDRCEDVANIIEGIVLEYA